MSHPGIRLGRDICTNPAESDHREWWLANGLGGYASGTVSGVLGRRYHGLLTVPLFPPLGRVLLFAKADADLLLGDRVIPLHTNHWSAAGHVPRGYRSIKEFFLDGNIPVWRFRVDKLLIEQSICMLHGRNATSIAYRIVGAPDARGERPRLRLGLVTSFRDHHYVNRIRDFELSVNPVEDGLRVALPQGSDLLISSSNANFQVDNTWIENFFLEMEQARGLEYIDNHVRIGFAEIELHADRWTGLVVGTERSPDLDCGVLIEAEQKRVAELQAKALPGLDKEAAPAWIRQLVMAADSFVFTRLGAGDGERYSIIAGYPWFGDWGRDTMIAVPGLCLATGRHDIALRILNTFVAYVSEGMLPNRFPGAGDEPEYNTVDAALWFIEAWRAYFELSGDVSAIRNVFPALQQTILYYRDGTRYEIAMDPEDGLITAGVTGQQLTWMDARVNGRVITPRHGKPVEINALWFNALSSMVLFCKVLDLPGDEYKAMAEWTAKGFSQYVREDGLGLYDVLDGPEGNDASIRPNQLLAVSLTYSPVASRSVMQSIVDVCERDLLTPVGLRSLASSDQKYVGRYAGSVAQRDGSYHQGTVWAWLLGHYALAEFRVTNDTQRAQQRLEPLQAHLSEAGIGTISEIFDGDAPHTPRGAPSQAWSVACTLEAWWKLELKKSEKRELAE
ncbi:MAG: amylo-alpha-1,6-glucosidase [Gammaproteobacteria bacterium]